MRRLKITIFVLMLFSVTVTYAGMGDKRATSTALVSSQTETQLGDPLSGLSDKELGRFNIGKREFERRHTPEDGLGPTFNQVSCVACHSAPVTGGSLADKRD